MAANAARVRDGQTALALRLTKYLALGDGEKGDVVRKNVAFSPVFVHAVLAIVAAGAHGATLAQLLHFLGAPTAKGLASFGRTVADRVLAHPVDSRAARVLDEGGFWIVGAARGGVLKEAFQKVAGKLYQFESPTVKSPTVSFTDQPEGPVEIINRSVKEATNGLIDSILSVGDITADTNLLFANVVCFKGQWLDSFCSSRTTRRNFHLLDGECVVMADFMVKITSSMDVSCMDGFKVLRLPYDQGSANGDAVAQPPAKRPRARPRKTQPAEADGDTRMQFSMFVFLPDKPDGIANMVDMITASPEYLYSVLPTGSKPVKIELPKFEISFDWNLGSDLRRLGLTLPFSKEVGDLRGIYAKEDGSPAPTFLGKVDHKAVVKVNEHGTEADPVMYSKVSGGPLPDQIQFVANHPFTFLIMEEKERVIVFAGHVLDPTCKSASIGH